MRERQKRVGRHHFLYGSQQLKTNQRKFQKLTINLKKERKRMRIFTTSKAPPGASSGRHSKNAADETDACGIACFFLAIKRRQKQERMNEIKGRMRDFIRREGEEAFCEIDQG